MSAGNKLLQAAAGVSGEETDANFANTVLLLNADDASNGGQNNTFEDSSSNAHTITRNGNVTQGSFSPFAKDDGKWGNYFDGSNTDYLTTPSSSASALGDDFTIEMWINPNSTNTSFSTSSASTIIDADSSQGGGTDQWTIHQNGSNIQVVSNNTLILQTTSNLLVAGEYQHVAVVRSSNTLTVYINGVDAGNTTYTTTITGNRSIIVGKQTGNNRFFRGYISNVRVVPGTAVYTSTFTPSTTPLTAITNTSLLTCQSNRFIDNSTNAHAITVNGTPKVTTFSPFPQTTPYSADTNGGSGYFDTSGDYLQFTKTSDFELDGDFTFEAWYYYTGSTGTQPSIFSISNSANTGFCQVSHSRVLIRGTSSAVDVIDYSGYSLPLNAWSHLAITRSGSTVRFFINGVLETSTTSSATINSTATLGYIGRRISSVGTAYSFGYISNLRLIKGTAVYTSAFTPPTAPLTDITNTSLLCNFTNASITDLTGSNVLETVGNAQVDTTTVKYGTGAMEFDGTGDYLEIPFQPYLQTPGDFTVECWVYVTGGAGSDRTIVIRSGQTGTQYSSYEIQVGSANVFRGVQGSGDGTSGTQLLLTGTTTVSLNTWYHVALVKNGATTSLYVNGTSEDSGTSGTADGNTDASVFVGRRGLSSDNEFSGFVDDLRITKGIARYTTTFTPPTKALPVIGE